MTCMITSFLQAFVLINQLLPLLQENKKDSTIVFLLLCYTTVFSQEWFCCETGTKVTKILLCGLCVRVLQTVSFGQFPNSQLVDM